ncbi:MAG: DUF1679 domain-containing protein, partial [Planctomycetaceae bacterium]
AWGVSNVVLRVTPANASPFVLKQSREQLRTRDAWFSRLERIWREADVMRVLRPLLPAGVVPEVLWEDRENFVFAMEAAPEEHVVWKQSLLAGEPSDAIARSLGMCLGLIHARTANRSDWRSAFEDRQVFSELRVDPFYRHVAQAAPDVAPQITALIDEMFATSACLVHADFSPKNVLVTQGEIVLVDYETAHYGDPAFDLGFFLSHLLLKTLLHADRFDEYARMTTEFWSTYRARVALVTSVPELSPDNLLPRMIPHLAGCMWARIDGTSKIDYLPDEARQNSVRRFCRELLFDRPDRWSEVVDRLRQTT